MPIEKLVETGVMLEMKKSAAIAATKTESSPSDGIDDLAAAIAAGIKMGMSDPALHASLSAIVVPPAGLPTAGLMISQAIMGAL